MGLKWFNRATFKFLCLCLATLDISVTDSKVKTRQIYLLFFLWEVEFANGATSCSFSNEFPLINQLTLAWRMVPFA